MGFECVMCMETLETPAPADIVYAPQTQPDVNQPGNSTNPENTQEYRSICVTSCGHMFHRVCLNRWFMQRIQKQCPSCRNSLVESNIFHIYPLCVSKDLVHQKMMQLTEMESSLPQCDCGSQKCGQLYDIHKTLVSDHYKLLELLQKFTDQSDNKKMLEARVTSLEEECARLKLLESPSTSTAERSENPPWDFCSLRRHLSSPTNLCTLRRSPGYSSLVGKHASHFEEDFDDGGYLPSRARGRMSTYGSRFLGFDGLESVEEASNASRNLLSPKSCDYQQTSTTSRNLYEMNLPASSRPTSNTSRNEESMTSSNTQETCNDSRNLEADVAVNFRGVSNSSRNLDSLEPRDAQKASTSSTASRNRVVTGATAAYICSRQRSPLSCPHRSSHTSRYLDSLESRNAQHPNASDYSEMKLRSGNTAPTPNYDVLFTGSSQGIADIPRSSHRYTKITHTHPPRNSESQTPRSASRFLHHTKETAQEYWAVTLAAVSNKNSLMASTERKEFAATMRSVFGPQQETPTALSLPLPPAFPTSGTIADSAVEESMPDGPDTPPSLFNNVSENSTISVTSSTSAVVAGNVAQRSGNEPSTSTDINTQLPSTSSSSTDNSLKSSRPSWVLMPWSINRKRKGHNPRLELKTTAGLPPPRSRASPELEHSTSPAISSNSENLQGERNEISNRPHSSSNITEITLDDKTTTDGVVAQAGPSYLASTSESTAPGEKITPTASSGIKAVKVSGSLPSSAKESNNNNRRKLLTATEVELELQVNKLGQQISTLDSDSD